MSVWMPLTGHSLSVLIRSEHQGWASATAVALGELERGIVVSLVANTWLDQVLDHELIVEHWIALSCCSVARRTAA